MITTRLPALLSSLCMATALMCPPAALALQIELPDETARYVPSELPGYALVQGNCLTCHSAHYVLSQPPTSPRAYWEATVKKMRKPFGAALRDEDLAPIVDYLVKTYGAERPLTAPPMKMQKRLHPGKAATAV